MAVTAARTHDSTRITNDQRAGRQGSCSNHLRPRHNVRHNCKASHKLLTSSSQASHTQLALEQIRHPLWPSAGL
eukprot:11155496-Lingulodinium_polyedra.AAC.1